MHNTMHVSLEITTNTVNNTKEETNRNERTSKERKKVVGIDFMKDIN
jgi:hypothetical protein